MFSTKKKNLDYLRSIWGKEIDKHRNFDLISSFHEKLAAENAAGFVDDNTWADLDFNKIFSQIDRCTSGVGQQYLYHLLHRYEDNEDKLSTRFKLISHLKDNQKTREEIQLTLSGLSGVNACFIQYLLLNKTLYFTKFYPLFYLCSLLCLVSLLLIPLNGIFLFVSLGILLINIILNKTLSGRIYESFAGFAGLNSLISSSIKLSGLHFNEQIPQVKLLRQKKDMLYSLRKKTGYLVIDKQSLNDLSVLMIEYLNMFFLFDIIAYFRSVKTLTQYQDDLLAVWKCIGELDAAISIASYLEGLPYYANPEFIDSNRLSFEGMVHPLIPDSVSNSITGLEHSVLVTGSNMAGKTTFIKTIGVNTILSRTLFLALANKFILPKYEVKSFIRRQDNLEDGKSYFFVEIEELKKFIVLSQTGKKYMFLIDEIFRGTNTIERLAASTSVLKYLDNQHRVFVTTHDIELQEMLKGRYKMFHFSELVEDDRYFFDYKIKEGPCSSGNAIKLLEIMSYPESVIIESKELVKKLLN